MGSDFYVIAFLCLSSGLWIGANAEANEDECGCRSCPAGWTELGDTCYLYQSKVKDWAEAEKSCVALGGNLASVHTKEQYDLIKHLIKKATGKDARTWIGGNDGSNEGVWLWSDGSKFAFKFWDHHSPAIISRESIVWR